MAGISLLWIKRFTGTSLIFTLRSVDNRVLLNLASPRHQLAKQSWSSSLSVVFFFIYLSLFLIFLQFTRLVAQSIVLNVFFLTHRA